MSILESTVNNIDSLNKTSIEQAKKRLDRLIKPQGSLGKMEDICMQLAGIHKSKYFDTSKKVVIAFGADHGVYEEGVASKYNIYAITKLYKRNMWSRCNK